MKISFLKILLNILKYLQMSNLILVNPDFFKLRSRKKQFISPYSVYQKFVLSQYTISLC